MGEDTDTLTISVVIPTLDRQQHLINCVESLARQTQVPEEVIIVNDGPLSADNEQHIRETLTATELTITSSKGRPSSSVARNTGLDVASEDIVLFLDDDVILGERYVADLLDLYRRHGTESLAGIAGFDNTDDEPLLIEKLYNRLFHLGSDPWTVNEVGFQYPVGTRKPELTDLTRADWIPGNNASYYRTVIEDYEFHDWGTNCVPLEDYAFTLMLGAEGYHFLMAPSLSIRHLKAEDQESSLGYGFKYGQNRVRIFREFCDQQYFGLFLWAGFGDILRTYLAPLVAGRPLYYWKIAVGMTLGFVCQLLWKQR
jgi:glycosyltransferase involved in cell wall biosynthesis